MLLKIKNVPPGLFYFILCLGLALATSGAKGQGLPSDGSIEKGDGLSIYASHHSYFLGVLGIIKELVTAGGSPSLNIQGSHYIGGSQSYKHWNLPDPNKPKELLATGGLDVLILTPIYLPDDGIEKFAELAAAHSPKVRVTIMELWLPYDVYNPVLYDKLYQPQAGEPPLMPKPLKVDHNAATGEELRKIHAYYFQTMDEHIRELNRKLGREVISVVPVGQAVIALREKVIAGQVPGVKVQEELFADGLGHPRIEIQLLEAYCHYAVIYGKSPVGLPVPSALAKSKIPAEDQEALNKLLQTLAWDAVIHHPLSGVGKP